MTNRKFYIALGFISLIAAALVLISTRWGAFLSDDSYYYIQPARAALSGQGFSPSPLFGPLLPTVLLILGRLGFEPLIGVRLLHAFLFAASVWLSGEMLYRLGAPAGFALFGAAIVAMSENAIETYSWAMSEALSITLELFTVYLLIRYWQDHRWRWLIGGALAAALACLARYAALPIVAAGALGLLLLPLDQKAWTRLRDALIFGLISLLPLAVYILRNQLLLGRPLYYPTYSSTPFTLDNLTWYAYNSLSWFIPGRLLRGRELLAALLVLILAGAALIGVWLRTRNKPVTAGLRLQPPGVILMLLFVLFNYLMLYFARGLAALAVYNPRYLVPPLLALWLCLIFWLAQAWSASRLAGRVAAAFVCVVYLAYYGFRAVDVTRSLAETGLGYANIGWHQSETVDYLRQNPGLDYVATGDVGLYFWTGKLPKVITTFGSSEGLHSYLCSARQPLIIMNQMPTEIYHMDHDQVVQGLILVKQFNDSEMYQCK